MLIVPFVAQCAFRINELTLFVARWTISLDVVFTPVKAKEHTPDEKARVPNLRISNFVKSLLACG